MKFQRLSLSDPSYPELLRNIYDPPAAIGLWGTLPDWSLHPPLAVVGSRKPTDYGIESAKEIVKGLSRAGFTIVSGLAYGIDSVAHKTCLEERGVTVAVLGSGLSKIYPASHRKLAEDIAAKGGAVISEYDDTMPALPHNFPKRNRIISGLSLGILVVEAAMDSGTLITARSALEQGREVFAVPGPIGNINTSGTHRLIREGAALTESAQDIIDILESRLSQEWKVKFSGQSFGVGDKERRILNMFGDEPVRPECLIERAGLGPGEFQSVLTVLECSGLIRAEPDGRYTRSKTHD